MSSFKLKFFWKFVISLELIALLGSFPAFANQFTILHTFGGSTQSAGATNPSWLLQGRDGNLYGSTYGSSFSPITSGVLFKINIAEPTPIYSEFLSLGLNDVLHFGHFVQSRNGNFYVVGLGLALFAGAEELFQVNTSVSPPLLTHVTNLPTFIGDAVGTSELLEGEVGKFYTTTDLGGTMIEVVPGGLVSSGMILQINTASVEPTERVILHQFDFINGANPSGGFTRYPFIDSPPPSYYCGPIRPLG